MINKWCDVVTIICSSLLCVCCLLDQTAACTTQFSRCFLLSLIVNGRQSRWFARSLALTLFTSIKNKETQTTRWAVSPSIIDACHNSRCSTLWRTVRICNQNYMNKIQFAIFLRLFFSFCFRWILVCFYFRRCWRRCWCWKCVCVCTILLVFLLFRNFCQPCSWTRVVCRCFRFDKPWEQSHVWLCAM